MTIDELKKESYFIALSEQTKVFVLAYCQSGGNKTESAMKGWPNSKSVASADSQANRALRRPDVRWLINTFFGKAPDEMPFTQDELKGFVAKKIRTIDDEALRFKYVQVYMDMEGWKQKPTDAPREEGPKNDGDEPFQL